MIIPLDDTWTDDGKAYFIMDAHAVVKIGWCSFDLDDRLKQLQTGSSSDLFIVGWISGPRRLESILHKIFEPYRVCGEWFKYSEFMTDFIRENCTVPYVPPPDPDGPFFPYEYEEPPPWDHEAWMERYMTLTFC